ncbi:glycoside hydrolase family 43 protein [Streptomyces sp. NBC_00341]|uniref:glycoside hydrolase family 43 protein n=1 Tax=unclassified Streptomyces TaxID=2593676 RepID=UPI002E2C2BE2|nr:family 43 glycosylhydrolase [Streptomyces sp. NBC_00304]WRZ14877.1 glycoside hydrolase family 43 protein [Streptomyces sp. NBC_00341]
MPHVQETARRTALPARLSNPVVRGIAADPSVCRVGEDYYLATSTMDFWPGIPIRHSRDLVHWRVIGYAVTRPAQYRRDGRPGPLNLYAPTLRHDGKRFHLACTNVADEQGNFVVGAEDPAGEWSDAAWVDREGFDPSLTFADGTCYYTRRTLDPLPDGRLGPVVQSEIDPATGVMSGPLRELTTDWSGFCSNDIEGPHLYKIDDWYYLFSAEGGTGRGHMQTCARSRSPWGPFTPAPHNPVLTHRHRVGHPVQSTGHAELVDAPDGSWWALFLGTRHDGFAAHHQLGRETFLAPVEWTDDGWPVIGRDGTVELDMELPRPLPGGGRAARAPRSFRETVWTAGWATVAGPPPQGLVAVLGDQDRAPGLLDRLTLPALAPGEGEWPAAALLWRQQEFADAFGATLRTLPEGASAGVAVYADAAHHYRLAVGVRAGRREAVLHRVVDDLATTEVFALPDEGPVRLDIEADGTHYRFRATVGGVGFPVGQGLARLLAAEVTQGFTGARFAVFASGTGAGEAVLERVGRVVPGKE